MKINNKVFKTFIQPALKPMFGKFAKSIFEKMATIGGDTALIDIEGNKVVVGVRETGEVKFESEAKEFENIGSEFMKSAGSLVEGVIDAKQAQKFITSMQIEINAEIAQLFVKSEIFGNFDFKYDLNDIRKTT